MRTLSDLDPLTCDIWHLIYAYDIVGRDITCEGCTCYADYGMRHSRTCALNGIYGQLCAARRFFPEPPFPGLMAYPAPFPGAKSDYHLWVFCASCQRRMGEINCGIGHWCKRERRWVSVDEW